jgi:hypothetical protein
MLQKDIIFFGRNLKHVCDGNCRKAWGTNSRPAIYFDRDGNEVAVQRWVAGHAEGEEPPPGLDGWKLLVWQNGRVETTGEPVDWDDFAYLADGELGEAPENPCTSEGFDFKPDADDPSPEKINRWCVRQCERHRLIEPGEPIRLKDFSRRRYNIPSRHPEAQK